MGVCLLAMPHKRALMAGMTNYTGVGLNDILADIRQWHTTTEETITTLRQFRKEVESNAEIFEDAPTVLEYIDHFCYLFERYASDFRRLAEELPRGVRDSHVETVSQLYTDSRFEDKECVDFKHEFIQHRLLNEQARPKLDAIYSETRGTLIDYRDLSNLAVRLRALSGSSPLQGAEIVQLRPGIWGFSIDLKGMWRWIKARWPGKDTI
jgi:hypothetical protein